jgi:Mg2+/Co2+ transporter CorC
MGKAVDTGLSRLPVLEPTIDAGVAYARDLLRGVHDERGGGPVRRLLRPAHFVPETNASRELLAEMRVGHFNLATVVDDYGAIGGSSPSRT